MTSFSRGDWRFEAVSVRLPFRCSEVPGSTPALASDGDMRICGCWI